MNIFRSKSPHYEYLRKKWTAKHREVTDKLFEKHLHKVAAGSLGGLMLLSTPGLSLPAANHQIADANEHKGMQRQLNDISERLNSME